MAILKLQEELGKLAQAHLRLSGRGRGAASADGPANEAAVVRKWLAWLEPAA